VLRRLLRLGEWQPMPRRPLTPRRAVRAIASFTFVVTLLAGLLIHLLDRSEFPTLGRGLWWAVQTVTTVGYGDSVPEATIGQIVAVVVMLSGIAGVSVATAAVSAALIDQARRRELTADEQALSSRLDRLSEQLDRVEESLRRRPAA
jgi:voltage-gated potassium channel